MGLWVKAILAQWEMVAVEYLSRHFVVTVILLFLLQLVLTKIVRRDSIKFRAVDNLPGASGFLFLGPMHYMFRDMRDILNLMTSFTKKYGNVMKINLLGERYVFLNSPEYAQILLSSNDAGHLDKAHQVYDISARKVLGDGLVMAPVGVWRAHRQIISQAFSHKSLRNYTHTINRHAKLLVQRLEVLQGQNSGEENSCQIHEFLSYCAINTITDVATGLDSQNDALNTSTLLQSNKRIKEITIQRERSPLLFFNFVWKLHPLSQEYAQVTKDIDNVILGMIQQYKNSLDERELHEDIMELEDDATEPFENMLELMHNSGMSQEDIFIELKTMIIKGFETTSASVQYLLLNLALNQEHQRSSREEIDRVFDNPTLCPGGNLSFDALAEMKCLERCIYETLRMFPVILCLVRKLASPLKLDDQLELPPATNVVVLPHIFHKNPEYFPNPEAFDPDRFLLSNSRSRHAYSFIPFSTGPRNCVGAKFGLVAMKAMTAHILRNFEVWTRDNLSDVPLLPSIVLTPERDYNFVLKKREH